jgi:flavin-dependent dehydrogenase
LDVSWSVHQACAGAGYFLLGDAAAVLDPSSSHGVLRATMSGMLCGHLVAAHAQRGLPESEVVAIYKGWMRSYLNHDVVLLRELYRNHPSTELAALFAASTVYAHSSDRLGR